MNKAKYKLYITNESLTNTPSVLSFFKYIDDERPYDKKDLMVVINFYIMNIPNPILRLDCNTYDNNTDLYEYGINYIIDNKIGKYSYLTIFPHSSHNIIAYFDVIDKEILLQLI